MCTHNWGSRWCPLFSEKIYILLLTVSLITRVDHLNPAWIELLKNQVSIVGRDHLFSVYPYLQNSNWISRVTSRGFIFGRSWVDICLPHTMSPENSARFLSFLVAAFCLTSHLWLQFENNKHFKGNSDTKC